MKKSFGKKIKKSATLALCMTMLAGSLESMTYASEVKTLQNAKSTTTLKNPVIAKNTNMDSGQNVTYDCVYFGTFPQSEVKSDDSVYKKLKDIKSWDANGDATYKGVRYRRLKRTQAVNKGKKGYKASESGVRVDQNYYCWENDKTYHYFKYEPLKWRVLKTDGKEALILSEKAITNIENDGESWAYTPYRGFLNSITDESEGSNYKDNGFLHQAFDEVGREAIIRTALETVDEEMIDENDSSYSYKYSITSCGEDKVFLLDKFDIVNATLEDEEWNDETGKYEKRKWTTPAKEYGFDGEAKNQGLYDEARRCEATDYAKALGCYQSTESKYLGNCNWLLRSYVYKKKTNGLVTYKGIVSDAIKGTKDAGIRPALTLDLSKTSSYSYAGTVSTSNQYKSKDNYSYKITKAANAKKKGGEVELFEYYDNNIVYDAKKFKVADKVKINGINYKVTKVSVKFGVGKFLYKISNDAKNTKKAKKAKKKNFEVKVVGTNSELYLKKATIASTINIGGKKYKVTSISTKAFADEKKIKKLTLGKNIKTIDAKAFSKCKKLSKVIIKSKKLTKIGKGAFYVKGGKKITIKVPGKKKEAYKNLLKKAGYANYVVK